MIMVYDYEKFIYIKIQNEIKSIPKMIIMLCKTLFAFSFASQNRFNSKFQQKAKCLALNLPQFL